jgi:hypothetical protein
VRLGVARRGGDGGAVLRARFGKPAIFFRAVSGRDQPLGVGLRFDGVTPLGKSWCCNQSRANPSRAEIANSARICAFPQRRSGYSGRNGLASGVIQCCVTHPIEK